MKPYLDVPLRDYQKFRIANPTCPICNERWIDSIIEDFGKVKMVRAHGVTAWITRNHRPNFKPDEKALIENEMQKRIGTPLIMWEPEEPLRFKHAYCYVLNTHVTRKMLRVANVARNVLD